MNERFYQSFGTSPALPLVVGIDRHPDRLGSRESEIGA